jgi:hypothetical protein
MTHYGLTVAAMSILMALLPQQVRLTCWLVKSPNNLLKWAPVRRG